MRFAGINYDSPNSFTRKQRLALAVAPLPVSLAFRGLLATCRTEVREQSLFDALVRDHGHVLVAFWHETLALAAWHFRGTAYHTLTSYSFDGELAARFVEQFGLHAVRGSSSRGGREALSDMIRAARLTPAVGFTLDGPRGPRRRAKPGIALLAIRSGCPVIPLAVAVTRAWRLNSWDRLQIPKPGARVVWRYGPVTDPELFTGAHRTARVLASVETSLNRLHDDLETEAGVDPGL